MHITRRAFVGSALATAAISARAAEKPLLTFGVLSDVHIGGRTGTDKVLRKALSWLDAKGVEAVLFCGDVVHSGYISQFETFAKIWHEIFPNHRAADGRSVPFMLSAGNHEFPEWPGRAKLPAEKRRQQHLEFEDNPQRCWDKYFGETFSPVWRKEVKGFTFVGAHWRSCKPQIEKYMKEQAHTFDPARPFFYAQHAHPYGTCHGSYAGGAMDRKEAVRALSPFPNAVAFSGHSHCSLTDPRTVWQGAFTSIGAGCMHEGGGSFAYDNITARWYRDYRTKFMKAPWNDSEAWGGDPMGGGCEYVEVFADHLVVHRHSLTYDMPFGPAWVVPVPARKGSPFDFATKAQRTLPPQFGAQASVRTQVCPKGHPLQGVGHPQAPCLHVSFPRAETRSETGRVFDYQLAVQSGGQTLCRGQIFAPNYTRPEPHATLSCDWLYPLKDLPQGRALTVSVTPRDSFRNEGRTLVSASFTL